MTTRATIHGHPLHAALVAIPIGLFVFSLVADIVFLITGDGRWDTAADFTLAGGVVGALVAAVPGFIDYFGLTDSSARRTATLHMIINIAIVVVAAFNAWLRFTRDMTLFPVFVSIASVIALVVSGYLGGQLVHVQGVTQPGNPQGGEKREGARAAPDTTAAARRA